MAGQTTCGLHTCNRPLKQGAARVGYEVDNQLHEVIVCGYHYQMVALGQHRIEHTKAEKPVLVPIPARPIFIQ